MKPRVAIVLTAGLLLIARTSAWPQEGTAEANRRYEVPTGGTAELLKFVDGLSRFQPTTTQADFEHREVSPGASDRCRADLRAGKRPLVGGVPGGGVHRACESSLVAGETDAGQQRQTVADVKAYLKAGGQEFAVPKTVEGIPVQRASNGSTFSMRRNGAPARERWSAGTPSITRMVRRLPCRLSSDRMSAIGMTRTWIAWESRYPEEGLSGLAATVTATGTAL